MKKLFTTYDDLDPVRKVLCTFPRVTNQDLARHVGLDDGTVSRHVDSLVAEGLVHKERDGKAVAISLPRGTQVYSHMFKVVGIYA